MNVLLLVLGALMEAGVVLILFIPIVYPPVTSPEVGVDPIHLGVIMCVNLMIGVATPPVGMCLFVMSHISKLRMEVLMKSILPSLVPIILCLLLITCVPQFVMVLPNLFMAESSGRAQPTTQTQEQSKTDHVVQTQTQTPRIAHAADTCLVKIGVTHSQNHSFTQALFRFGEKLEAMTNGRYRVKVYYGAQLGSEKVL